MQLGKLVPGTFVDAVVPTVGLLAMMAAVATMVVGLTFLDGRTIAASCEAGGIAVTAYAWHMTRCSNRRPASNLVRVALSLGAGLSVYFGMAWLLGSCRVPVDLRFAHDPAVADARWIALGLLAYTGLCFSVLRGSRAAPGSHDGKAGSGWFFEGRVGC